MIQALLSKFEGVRKTRDGWQAKCPCHEDNVASLAISIGENGKPILHDHAGCDTRDILASIGLTFHDLMKDDDAGFPKELGEPNGGGFNKKNPATKQPLKQQATYDYVDEGGNLLYQVVRYLQPDGDKTFRQRKPDGKGGWLWSLGNTRRVLYRLDEVLAADPRKPILIVEGEKDVDRLRELGFTATTNVGGAGKWRASYNDVLRQKRLVPVPDNDPPGESHVGDIAQSLDGAAASLKVLRLPNLPPKGDMSDWIEAGGDTEQLLKLIAECPEWTPQGLTVNTSKDWETVSQSSRDTENQHHDMGRQNDADQNDQRSEERSWLPLLANAEKVGEGEDQEIHPRSMADILASISKITDGWPRRVGTSLFIDDPKHGLHTLAKVPGLFGWLASHARVVWYRTTGCVSQAEVFEELQRTATAYRAIETFPHFPPFGDHYYAHDTIKPGNGEALRKLIDRFAPATDIDRDLLLTLFATAVWGGPGGARPAFVLTSDDGRGVGKTTIIKAAGQLFGGVFAISRDEKAGDVVKRLLTPEAATKRVALMDNVKAARLSWAELEALITAAEVSGHRLYQGERTRPNTLLWCLTLNGPAMSRDMAQRSCIIKLIRPEYSGSWEEDTAAFIEQNRWTILADLAAFHTAPRGTLERYTRWSKWEADVLTRLPEPAEAQKVILERQAEVDADDEEAAGILDHFAQQLDRLGYAPENESVHIPSLIARDWYAQASGQSISTTAMTRAINQAANEGTLKGLSVNPCRTHGRGLLWMPCRTAMVSYDLDQRLRDRSWQDT